MKGSLTPREQVFRGALGVFLVFVAYDVGVGSPGTEARVVAWGALVLGAVAILTAGAGTAGPASRVGLDADWSMAFLAARLYVGWEFLHAGWLKATSSWYDGAGAGEVKGTVTGAIAQSHATAKSPFPAVSDWFAWLSQHLLVSYAELLSYLVVTGELCVGIGLMTGLFLRLSGVFGVTLNSLFMFAGALGAGLNPEMVLLGMTVVLASGPGVNALSVDRFLLPRLRTISPGRLHLHRHHVPA